MKLTVLLGVAGAEGNGLAWTLWVDSEEDDDSLNQSSSPHYHHHWPTILMIFVAHLGLGGGGSRKTPGCPDKPTSIFNGWKKGQSIWGWSSFCHIWIVVRFIIFITFAKLYIFTWWADQKCWFGLPFLLAVDPGWWLATKKSFSSHKIPERF